MRKKAIVILALWIVSGVLIFNGCKGKLPVLEKEKAVDLIKRINAAPTGFQIEAEASAIAIEADPKSSKRAPRYFIAISEPKITFNPSVFEEIYFPIPEFVLDFDCEKVVLHYHRDCRSISFRLVRIKGICLQGERCSKISLCWVPYLWG